MRPLTLSLSPFGGEGIETAPSPSSIKRVGVRVAYAFTHNPGQVSAQSQGRAYNAGAMRGDSR